jgi:hypothetical protein
MKTKFLTLTLIAVVAMTAAFTACENGTGETPETEQKPGTPGTGTETKTVTVSFPAFTPNSTSFSLAPTYTPTGGWGNFSASDITSYVVTDNKGHSSANGDFSGNTVNANIYANNDEVVITQTFNYNGKAKTSTFATFVENNSGLRFLDIYVDTSWAQTLSTIPAITLTLTK